MQLIDLILGTLRRIFTPVLKAPDRLTMIIPSLRDIRDGRQAGKVEEDTVEETKGVNSRENTRYSLVEQNNGYYGCFDGKEGELILFRTREEAEAFINDRMHGGSNFKAFYWSKN
jgi:hypothetical protein